jgi:hypothetical protein
VEWRQATEQQVARLNREAQAVESAQQVATAASRQAVALLQPPPPVLTEEPPLGVDPSPAREAWLSWARRPDADITTANGLMALATHLDQALGPLTREVDALSGRISVELSERDDKWSPIAAAISSWCGDAETAEHGLECVPSIKAAETWLKAATDHIRNERLAPLASQARSIWAMLRQESNVDLGAIRLVGSSTSRHVELDVSVDGRPRLSARRHEPG